MNYLTFIFFVNVIGNLCLFVNCDDDPIVSVPNLGSLRGKESRTIGTNQLMYEFLGIPYAESPSGLFRYKRPIKKSPWNGIENFQLYGRGCPEVSRLKKLSDSELREDIENCLTLNIYTKNLNNNANVPIMFYVHGGAFSNGTASEFPGNHLLRNDIVLVTIQYRLGILGFASTQTNDIPGNVAILDILLALEWVQDNIKYFGGDPNKVTIVGQSAGSSLTSVLTISPYVRSGLFNRLIIQSGSILAPWAIRYDPIKQARDVCNNICDLCLTIDDINQCLLSSSVSDLINESAEIFYTLTLNDLFGILPDKPKILIQNLKSSNYEIMGGATKHDGSYTLSVFYDSFKNKFDFSSMSPREIITNLLNIRLMGEEDEHSALYNFIIKSLFTKDDLKLKNSKSLIPKYIDIATLLSFESPTLSFVEIMSRHENSKNYLYKFDYQGEFTRFGYESGNTHYPFNGGAHHSDDNIYLYPYPYANLNENDLKISNKMCNIWSSFVINGKPETDGMELPSVITGTTGPFFHIDNEITIGEDYFDDFFVSQTDPDSGNLIRL